MSVKHFLAEYLPWVLSILGVYLAIQTGNLKRWAWAFGLCIQLLWLIWILCSENYGFLIQNATLWIIYYRNHMKWKNATLEVAK